MAVGQGKCSSKGFFQYLAAAENQGKQTIHNAYADWTRYSCLKSTRQI